MQLTLAAKDVRQISLWALTKMAHIQLAQLGLALRATDALKIDSINLAQQLSSSASTRILVQGMNRGENWMQMVSRSLIEYSS